MTDLRKAAEMAFNALLLAAHTTRSTTVLAMCAEATDALRQALAQPEQEPVAWRNAAIRLGEDLYSVGPNGYYDMTAKEWLDWALSVVTAAPISEPVKERISEPVENLEPVAWLHPDKKVDVVVPSKLAWFDKPIPLYAATRRAIVRAAAEIGKEMK